MGKTIGKAFGKKDNKATVDNGQGIQIDDPNDGLNEGQQRNRKFLKLGGAALSGLEPPAAPRAAGNQLDLPTPGPMVDVGQQGNYLDGYLKRKRSPFFGESY